MSSSLRVTRPIPQTLNRLHHGTARCFATSPRNLQDAPVTSVPRPVGAFRGGLLGFLLGATLSGTAMYYSVVSEYRVSNELLTQDIFNLQNTAQRIEAYVKVLEDRIEKKN